MEEKGFGRSQALDINLFLNLVIAAMEIRKQMVGFSFLFTL